MDDSAYTLPIVFGGRKYIDLDMLPRESTILKNSIAFQIVVEVFSWVNARVLQYLS